MLDIKLWVIIGLGLLCGFLGISTMSYRTLYNSTDKAYKTQSKQVDETNKAAKAKYDQLKSQADTLQEAFDKMAKTLENKSEKGTAQIADDSKRDVAPVSVRVASCAPRSSGGGTSSRPAATTQDSAGPAVVPSGVLAPEAEELFKRDADGVEALQLAFNICKEAGK